MKLGDKVYIIPLKTEGRVVAFIEDYVGKHIQVRFLWEADARLLCFYDDELDLR